MDLGSSRLENLSQAIHARLDPRIAVSIRDLDHEGKWVYAVTVRGDGRTHSVNGRFYLRVGRTTVPMPVDEVRRRLMAEADALSSQLSRQHAPLSPSDYLLPAAALADRLAPWMLAGDEVPIRRFIGGAPAALFRAIADLEDADLDEITSRKASTLAPILDSLAVAAIQAVEYDHSALVPFAREAWWRIYERANNTTFPRRGGSELDAVWVWGEVIRRIYMLGSILVDRRQYSSIPLLVSQPIDWDDYYRYFYWARHAEVMLARADRMHKNGLVRWVHDSADANSWYITLLGGDREHALNRLCQFDFLQCVSISPRRIGPARPSGLCLLL